jgi:hypothetical protein
VAHRGAEPSRRVELDDERVIPTGFGATHLVLQEGLADGVDVVVELGDEHTRRRGRCGSHDAERDGHNHGRERKSPQRRQSHDVRILSG